MDRLEHISLHELHAALYSATIAQQAGTDRELARRQGRGTWSKRRPEQSMLDDDEPATLALPGGDPSNTGATWLGLAHGSRRRSSQP